MKRSSTQTMHTAGWQETLLGAAHSARRAALVGPPRGSSDTSGSAPRPALHVLDPDTVEMLLDTLCALGFSDDAAADAYRAFSWFLLGHLVVETSSGLWADIAAQEAGRPDPFVGHPTTSRLAARLRAEAAEEQFEVGLEQLLDRVALYRVAGPARSDLRREPAPHD